MCGIAGFHLRRPTAPISAHVDDLATDLLAAIEHRGTDATGYAVYTTDGRFDLEKASCAAALFNTGRRPLPANTRSAILHTRLATQGHRAFPQNNHPVRRGAVAIVHNGTIWNDAALFTRAETTRRGAVDSEAVAALLDRFGIGNPGTALEPIQGSYAIAALDAATGDVLLARGYSSPLHVLIRKDIVMWASTAEAISYAIKLATGHAPNRKTIRAMHEGTFLSLAGARITEGTFSAYTPPPRPPLTPWKPNTTSSYMPTSQTMTKTKTKTCELCRAVPDPELDLDVTDVEGVMICDDCDDFLTREGTSPGSYRRWSDDDEDEDGSFLSL